MKAINTKFQHINDFIRQGRYNDASKIIQLLDKEIIESVQIINNVDIYFDTDENLNYHISIIFNLGGFLVDIGCFTSNENILDRGIDLTENLTCIKNIDSHKYYPNMLYNLANGLSTKLKWNQGQEKKIFFKDIVLSERVKSIYRKAIQIDQTDPKIIINYANLLKNQFGRSYESLECYDKALSLNSNQAMALSNKAETLLFLLQFIGGNAAKTIIIDSYFMLKRAIEIGLETGPLNYFTEIFENLENNYPQLLEMEEYNCKQSIEDPKDTLKEFYMRFCHSNRLFLNPLSKEHQCPAALYDPLTISKMIVGMKDQEKYHRFSGYINRLKQEYIMARYLAAQSFYKNNELKFINDGISLIDTLDYKVYSIFLEHARAAYRMAYGILDKIAFVINEYQGIGFKQDRLSFHYLSFWKHCNDKLDPKICDKLNKMHPIRNPFLASILDLANDFENNYFTDLKNIRNALEHRFFDIYSEHSVDQIGPSQFRSTLLDLLRLVKNAIFYVVMMIDWEERKKETNIDPKGIINMQGILIPDDWKVE